MATEIPYNAIIAVSFEAGRLENQEANSITKLELYRAHTLHAASASCTEMRQQ